MRLKQRWTPPKGTLINFQNLGDELLFPVVTGRTEIIDGETHDRTHFGLWCIHRETGKERQVNAPFYLAKKNRSHPNIWDRRWRIHGHHDGCLIFSLGIKQSYDIAYHILAYNGKNWAQVVCGDHCGRLLTLGQNHTWRNIDAPGPLTGDCILQGGDIWTAMDPMRIAVDFTHAFSYDSGPETPNSPEYLALQRETQSTTPSYEEQQKQKKFLAEQYHPLIPDEYIEQCQVRYSENRMSDIDKSIWVRVRTWGPSEFIQLIQLAA